MEWNRHIVVETTPHLRICFMTSNGPKANAHLIAAAPAMFEALGDALAVLTADDAPEGAHIDWAVDSIRSALAEARGENA